MRATLLTLDDHAAVQALLSGSVAESVFLTGMLERGPIGSRPGEQWWGAWDASGGLCGVAFCSPGPTSAGPGLWVFTGHGEAASALAHAMRDIDLPSMSIGPRDLVDETWAALGSPPPSLQTDSIHMCCTEVTTADTLKVRPARMTDLEWLREVSVAMMREDLGFDPRQQDPQAHETRLRAGIFSGRSWIGTQHAHPVFRLEVGTRSSAGIQVGGTWVPPRARGQGIANQGMAAVCRALLQDNPRVTLHVREDNHPAVQCYSRIGFVRGAPLRLRVG